MFRWFFLANFVTCFERFFLSLSCDALVYEFKVNAACKYLYVIYLFIIIIIIIIIIISVILVRATNDQITYYVLIIKLCTPVNWKTEVVQILFRKYLIFVDYVRIDSHLINLLVPDYFL